VFDVSLELRGVLELGEIFWSVVVACFAGKSVGIVL
jgi:hypothetical protein